jgi:transcriptional regulator with XRE-family HTH domain
MGDMGRAPFSGQLRRAVADSGLSRYRIAKEIGVTEATMSRFMSGQRGLSMAVVDRLCDLLRLSITTEPKSK